MRLASVLIVDAALTAPAAAQTPVNVPRFHAVELRGGNVAASIKGGGIIDAGTLRALPAAIHGGGSVRYCGEPAKTVSVHGGGTVTRSCPR